MIKIVDRSNFEAYRAEMEAAYRLRHEIFVEEAHWEALRRPDGREIDCFDSSDAVHMLLHEKGALIGYQRMLPTTSPYLLTEIYPQLCDERPPRSPHIFEWTRFAIRREYRGDGRSLGLAGARLVLAFVEWGLARGVDAVVVELHPQQMLKFAQCHFRAAPLGIVHRIDGQDVMAVLARFDHRTVARLQGLIAGFPSLQQVGFREDAA